ncbi:sensor histidine kinase [Nocardioides sp. CPCC 205120]|uniref:sensor histidine kinase n=1 Tax=Nocardioides sp. CPCC 205120 TaxID=3406462 RepID=UPI003B506BC9
MSTTLVTLAPGWDRWFRVLPMALLAGGLGIGFATQGFIGGGAPAYAGLAGLGAVSAVWIWWWTLSPAHRDDAPSDGAVYWWGRTALAFALTWVNPFLAFFAFAGYTDAYDVFRGRRALVAVGATAVTMAGSQAGGLPLSTSAEWGVFVVLVLVNAAIATVFSHFHTSVTRISDQRGEQVTELARLNAELSAALRRNVELSEQVAAVARESGVQAERQRLAREIHDTVAQGLAGVVTQLQAAEDDPDPTSAARHRARAEQLARESLAEARRSVQALAPATLEDSTLPAALDGLVSRWSATHDVAAGLVISGEPRALHPEVEATVVRVAQEALANVGRHARAGRVGVTLTYTDTEVIVDVRDDGVGFVVDAERPPTSFGLRGMRQRAERVAGRLDVESEPGGGTAVSAQLPAVWAGVVAEPAPRRTGVEPAAAAR